MQSVGGPGAGAKALGMAGVTVQPPTPPAPRLSSAIQQQVQVIAGAVAQASMAQPTTADVLRALQDLGTKVQHLSQNQKVIEAKLDAIITTSAAIDHNVIAGANWLRNWNYMVFMNLDNPPHPFMVSGINKPHWK
jgi:hypothetical protein